MYHTLNCYISSFKMYINIESMIWHHWHLHITNCRCTIWSCNTIPLIYKKKIKRWFHLFAQTVFSDLLFNLTFWVVFAFKSELFLHESTCTRHQNSVFYFSETCFVNVVGSHVSTNPSLEFIVYIPYRDQSPLYIYKEKGRMWLLVCFTVTSVNLKGG